MIERSLKQLQDLHYGINAATSGSVSNLVICVICGQFRSLHLRLTIKRLSIQDINS